MSLPVCRIPLAVGHENMGKKVCSIYVLSVSFTQGSGAVREERGTHLASQPARTAKSTLAINDVIVNQ